VPRYAIFSDVHSNIEALDAALALIREDDKLLCLGDIVGYGPNPNECVAKIRTLATATVLGNHDVAAIDNFGLAYFNPAAREAMRWTQRVINAENKEWLNSLGYEFRMPEFLLVHGAPKNYFEYILDKPGAARAFAATDAPVIFIGHTHIAEYYGLDSEGAISHKHLQQGGELVLAPGVRYIVNVGSVGQPRDLNPRASFGLFDSDARTVNIVRFDYAIAQVQEKIVSAHLPEALARRLLVGR
jgi:diadenosine tetraphosphatase ApaH/serine/threonine PP2A family protein phosphatase